VLNSVTAITGSIDQKAANFKRERLTSGYTSGYTPRAMKKIALTYTRVSTQEQADSRLGLESQQRLLDEYCERRQYIVSAQYCDEGVSGSTPLLTRREGWHIGQHANVVVVALSQDRLFRSVADMLATVEALAEENISVETVDEGPLDFEDEDRWLSAMIRAVFAELERRKARKRTQRALQAKRDRGEKLGEAPYGWKNVDGSFEPVAREQAAILFLEDRLKYGKLSLREIARELECRAFPTRGGGKWNHQQVMRIIARFPPSRFEDGESE
jgi:DNA invertase Pin-like site-specific DNA recombinase